MLSDNVREYINFVLIIRSIELAVVAICLVLLGLLGDAKPSIIMLSAIWGLRSSRAVPYNLKQLSEFVEKLSLLRMIFVLIEPFIFPIVLVTLPFVDKSLRIVVTDVGLSTYVAILLVYSVLRCVRDMVDCSIKLKKC